MPRQPRCDVPGVPQHIVQRGNNHQRTFHDARDFAMYRECLRDASRDCDCLLHAYVLMSNHVHLLATAQSSYGLSRMMQAIGRRYVRFFNDRHQRSGGLWDGRFKPSVVQDGRYLLACYRYIELNPVRAGLARDPADYPHSSYRCNGLGYADALVSPHPEYLELGRSRAVRLEAYRQLCAEPLTPSTLEQIRNTVRSGLILGDPYFRERIEAAIGRPVRHRRPGRPRS